MPIRSTRLRSCGDLMHALDIKLLRDFRRLWGQALAIALVLASGVMILLMAFGMFRALSDTLNAYYERNNFAHVWSAVEKAPRGILTEIAAIDGVQTVEGRIERYVVLDMPGRVKSSTGLALSLPENGALPHLNVPLLKIGRLPDPQASDEVMLSASFAEAHGLALGDRFDILMSGQKRQVRLVGTALSPEYVYAIGLGTIMPDDEAFGILWLPHAMLAAAYDMAGAIDMVTLSLGREAREDRVIAALDDLLNPYGGAGAFGRDKQLSHAFVDTEIRQLKSMSQILPPIFFGISAFLVNMVIGRIVALERAEIGLMKAIGYADWHIAAHFVLLAGLTAVLGVLIGWAAGAWTARWMAAEYAAYFKFPYLIFNVSYDAYAISAVLALLTAALGALRAALAAAWLPPAVAMSPPAPPHYQRSLFDRLLSKLRFSQPTMMIWRSVFRWPLRAALTSLGFSLAVAIMLSVGFFEHALNRIAEVAFDQANRQDIALIITPERSRSVVEDARKLPGVLQAEGEHYEPVTLRYGHREKQLSIITRAPEAGLARAVDSDGSVVVPEEGGIVVTQTVADALGLTVGAALEVEFMSGRRETHVLPVTDISEQYFGLGAYMSRATLARLERSNVVVSGINIQLDSAQARAFDSAIKDVPGVAGTVRVQDMRQAFEDTVEQNIAIMNGMFTLVAVLIGIGLAYNGARIQLSERARELASLRILGFSNWDVSYVLIGEIMLITLAAQPLGWLIGYGLAALMSSNFTSDLYSIPLVLPASAFARASIIVLGTSLISVLIVRRRIDRLDLVSVMKTRE